MQSLRRRIRAIRRSTLVLAALVVLSACAGQSSGPGEGASCVELCELAKDECEEAPQVACDDHCIGEDFRAEETGCRATYEDVIECSLDLDDVCSAPSACAPELIRFGDCVRAYCQSHMGDLVCRMAMQ